MVDDDNIVIVPQARIFFGAKEEKKRGSKRREKIQREREQNAFLRGGVSFHFWKTDYWTDFLIFFFSSRPLSFLFA